MKPKLLILSSILLLNACASTDSVATQGAGYLRNTADYIEQNKDSIDHALKRSGELIGKGMKATGEYLQEISQ